MVTVLWVLTLYLRGGMETGSIVEVKSTRKRIRGLLGVAKLVSQEEDPLGCGGFDL